MIALLAHAAPISYRFPIPVWAYALTAGVVVLLSAPAAALAVGGRTRAQGEDGDIYPLLHRLRLGPIGIALSVILLGYCIVGGIAAAVQTTDEARFFFENPATLLIWVDFWVLLGLASALVGNAWDVISPLSLSARALSARLERGGRRFRTYPARVGQWPAVVLVLLWSWMELVWDQAKQPHVLVLLLLVYWLATL